MNTTSRRWVAGFVRFGLVIAAFAVVGTWVIHRIPGRGNVRAQLEAPSVEALPPGDIRLYNADSAIDVVLSGDKILAGLSPKTVAKVRTELDSSRTKDTSGFGGSIASLVKKTVSGAIGTHIVYPLADIRDIRYDKGHLVLEWTKGGDHNLFGDTKVNDRRESNTFRADEAERFIEAVRARKRSLGQM
jgi:hypothetical protein